MLRTFATQPTARPRRERGQAIVIIAFSMIALLAFTGLAIDGGGLIALYREAVNATDAAVLASSYAICAEGDPVQAGLDSAAKNGFDNNGTTNWVTINYPPVSGDQAGNPDYVQVIITADKPAYFIQVVHQEPLRVNTNSVGYCRRKFDPSEVGAILGLSNTCANAVDISGAGQTIVGDVHSNSNVDFSGGGQPVTIDGDVSAAGVVDANPSKVDIEGAVENGVDVSGNPLAIVNINDYAPGGGIYEALPDDKVHYINGNFTPARGSQLEGLYFVEGDVNIGPSDNVTWGPQGATIVSRGVIDVHVDKGVPPVYYTQLLTLGYTDLPVVGFLMFSTAGVQGCTTNRANNAISFNGAINTAGVIYGPNGAVDASFPDVTLVGAVIGWRVKLSGAQATIIEDPALLPPLPPTVYIAQ
ncbi:MAG: Tad domain-containing protein [Anaerolineae bacterium]|jgi:hypothetical protein|nr:Tad domain-containing protein [Anaerolineae bacterium]